MARSPPKVSRRKKLDSLKMLAQGHKVKSVSNVLGVSVSTIIEQRRNNVFMEILKVGAVKGDQSQFGVPICLMFEALFYIKRVLIHQALLRKVLAVPEAHLDEYLKDMKDQFGVTVSKSRLSRIFANMRINRKKVLLPL
jgi:hypothetical protein